MSLRIGILIQKQNIGILYYSPLDCTKIQTFTNILTGHLKLSAINPALEQRFDILDIILNLDYFQFEDKWSLDI